MSARCEPCRPIPLLPGRFLAHNGAMRAGLHLFGWALLGLTILSLVGEMAARGLYDARGFYLSVEELWAALAPNSFIEFRSWFRSAARPFWTYGLGPVFKLPAWFLLGFPGLLAIGYARRLDQTPHDFDVDGVFLYEELVQRAKEEGHLESEERMPEDAYAGIAASARAAENDLALDPIVFPPTRVGEAKAEPETNAEEPPPLNRPRS